MSVEPACLGISGYFSHKPVGLLTCDILEVRGRFYWPGPSGLWLSSKTGHMIINEMFYIPIKLKPELARASMTTSDVNILSKKDAYLERIVHSKNVRFVIKVL